MGHKGTTKSACEKCQGSFWARPGETVCRTCKPPQRTLSLIVTEDELRILQTQATVRGISVEALVRLAVESLTERLDAERARFSPKTPPPPKKG
jgi:hypothetical protein